MAQRGGGGHGGGGGFHGGGGGFHGGGMGGGFHGGGIGRGGGFGGGGFRGGFGGNRGFGGFGNRGFGGFGNRGFGFGRGFGRGFGGFGGWGGWGWGGLGWGWPGWGVGWGWDMPDYGGCDPYVWDYGCGYPMMNYPAYAAPAYPAYPSYPAYPGDGYAAYQPGVTVVYPQTSQVPVYTQPAHPQMHQYDQYGQEVQPSGNAAAGSPIYLIAFKDHVIRAASAYWVDGNTLHYVTLQHEERQVPLDTVDRGFSRQLNRERHVAFQLPAQ